MKNVYQLHGEIRNGAADALDGFLAGLTGHDRARIEINSPGGSVLAGLHMANALKNCKAHVTAHVTGIAASMASVIACACDEIEMEEGSFLMIHNPWSWVEGDAETLRHVADTLDKMRDVIVAFYAAKFPARERAELVDLMAAETWMSGEECLAQGLVCKVIPCNVPAAACVSSRAYANIPAAAARFVNVQLAAATPPEDPAPAEDPAAVPPEDPAPAEDPAATPPEAPSADAPAEGAEAPAEGAEAPAEGAGAQCPGAEAQGPGAEAQGLGAEALSTPPAAENWEARYKGASKRINALQAELDHVRAECDGRVAAARDEVKNLSAALKSARADLSSVRDALSKAETSLAESREQMARLESAHALLTGGVLSPAAAASAEAEYVNDLKAARSPEQREAVRKAYRAKAKNS